MAKMLGQDLFTQAEFDEFKKEEYDKTIGVLMDNLSSLNEQNKKLLNRINYQAFGLTITFILLLLSVFKLWANLAL